jgi:hypothetical protein
MDCHPNLKEVLRKNEIQKQIVLTTPDHAFKQFIIR